MTTDNKIASTDSAYEKRGLFSVRQGRALRGERAEAMDTILPQISIPKDALTQDHKTPPTQLFDKKFKSHWLEIGFGHGEHVAGLMRRESQTGFLGAEPFINGMGSFTQNIKDDPLDNIRVIMDDGMIIARSLTPASLDGIYILNPDPWHKKRHHKRRLINHTTLDVLATILKPNADLVLTTDVTDLANWMCTHTVNHPAFTWTAKSKDDWQVPPQDWITTKYELKGAKGAKRMSYLFFKRK